MGIDSLLPIPLIMQLPGGPGLASSAIASSTLIPAASLTLALMLMPAA